MKCSIFNIGLAIIVVTLVSTAATAQSENEIRESIVRSHIEANVPDGKNFDVYLKRDLATYFKNLTGKDVAVEFELLREGPTQTGIAFPKFYAWVSVRNSKNIVIDEGAVRLAAIEKKRFEITHFLSRSEISKTPESPLKIFPGDIVKKIDAKLGRGSETRRIE